MMRSGFYNRTDTSSDTCAKRYMLINCEITQREKAEISDLWQLLHYLRKDEESLPAQLTCALKIMQDQKTERKSNPFCTKYMLARVIKNGKNETSAAMRAEYFMNREAHENDDEPTPSDAEFLNDGEVY